MPEVASLPEKLTVKAWLYQPLRSAARSGVAVTVGAVASYMKENCTTVLVFPATSVQLPESEALPLSGPLYGVLVQLSIPDVVSVPDHVTVNAWLYQLL